MVLLNLEIEEAVVKALEKLPSNAPELVDDDFDVTTASEEELELIVLALNVEDSKVILARAGQRDTIRCQCVYFETFGPTHHHVPVIAYGNNLQEDCESRQPHKCPFDRILPGSPERGGWSK